MKSVEVWRRINQRFEFNGRGALKSPIFACRDAPDNREHRRSERHANLRKNAGRLTRILYIAARGTPACGRARHRLAAVHVLILPRSRGEAISCINQQQRREQKQLNWLRASHLTHILTLQSRTTKGAG